MKKKLTLLTILICFTTTFSQTNYLVTEHSDGTKVKEVVSDITKLTFSTTFTCGDRLLYSGDVYPTVLIGGKCWFAKSLNVGTKIDVTSEQTNNSGTNIIEKYCYNDLESYCETYGGLYQWAEAMDYEDGASNIATNAFTDTLVQGICPTGWHIPTKAELQAILTAVTVSSSSNALKAVGQGTDSGIGTNTSGFSALLAGQSYFFGSFGGLGNYTAFWSSTEESTIYTYYMYLESHNDDASFPRYYKTLGYSVRCLQD